MRYIMIIGMVISLCGELAAMEATQGTFEVKIEPQEESPSEGVSLGRMSLKKTFSGGLSGKATGQMLTAVSQVPTSAVYVAVERFEGSLDGQSGSFAMTHRGVMTNGEQDLVIEIVPDSGTGELGGIRGSMTIEIREGQHFYVLNYEISQQ